MERAHSLQFAKNYSSANNMFMDLGQFKAYLSGIDSFGQLYIAQQGGHGVTRKQVITQLEKAIAKDAKSVYSANKELWNNLKISTSEILEERCRGMILSQDAAFQDFRNIIIMTK